MKTAIAVLAFSLATAGLAGAAPKERYHGGSVDARDHGYEHGYRAGLHQGVADRDHNNRYKPEVKDADSGYEKYMGDKDRYKEGYRSGFLAGYEDGFQNRRARFDDIYGPNDDYMRSRRDADRYDDVYADRGWGASDVAFDVGYHDGVSAGTEDYNRRRDPRPDDQNDFKNADHGYRSSYGDKDAYKQRYRDGFMQGYRDGYGGRRP